MTTNILDMALNRGEKKNMEAKFLRDIHYGIQVFRTGNHQIMTTTTYCGQIVHYDMRNSATPPTRRKKTAGKTMLWASSVAQVCIQHLEIVNMGRTPSLHAF